MMSQVFIIVSCEDDLASLWAGRELRVVTRNRGRGALTSLTHGGVQRGRLRVWVGAHPDHLSAHHREGIPIYFVG